MPTTANRLSTMIWRTAKSTEVSRPQTALPRRGAGPWIGRAAAWRAAMVAMAPLLRGGGDGRRPGGGPNRCGSRGVGGIERGAEVGDEVRLVLEPDAHAQQPLRDPRRGEGRRVERPVRARRRV